MTAETRERFSLANRKHLSLVLAILFAQGDMCPKCGHGTRATSKKWARCKKCGERVARRTLSVQRTSSEEPR